MKHRLLTPESILKKQIFKLERQLKQERAIGELLNMKLATLIRIASGIKL